MLFEAVLYHRQEAGSADPLQAPHGPATEITVGANSPAQMLKLGRLFCVPGGLRCSDSGRMVPRLSLRGRHMYVGSSACPHLPLYLHAFNKQVVHVSILQTTLSARSMCPFGSPNATINNYCKKTRVYIALNLLWSLSNILTAFSSFSKNHGNRAGSGGLFAYIADHHLPLSTLSCALRILFGHFTRSDTL